MDGQLQTGGGGGGGEVEQGFIPKVYVHVSDLPCLSVQSMVMVSEPPLNVGDGRNCRVSQLLSGASVMTDGVNVPSVMLKCSCILSVQPFTAQNRMKYLQQFCGFSSQATV
jgi:hypothetical protein